jgi:uracil-DNA glycosylase
MAAFADIPACWRSALLPRLDAGPFRALADFVAAERRAGAVFPPEKQVFRALELTPPEAVKVMLIGQDPYHDDDQAHGLAFSVPGGVKPPPSLRNIFKELTADLGGTMPASGSLERWAKSGVLLLNSVLTVRAHAAASHRDRGWEAFSDAVLQVVNAGDAPVVFLLWGNFAQSKEPLIDRSKHRVIASAHPSPLSAHRGFIGSRPFSRCNALLRELGREPVDWSLDNQQSEFDF